MEVANSDAIGVSFVCTYMNILSSHIRVPIACGVFVTEEKRTTGVPRRFQKINKSNIRSINQSNNLSIFLQKKPITTQYTSEAARCEAGGINQQSINQSIGLLIQ
jgi:hypothetical protein